MHINDLRKTIAERKQTILLRSVVIMMLLDGLFLTKAVIQGVEMRMWSLGMAGLLQIIALVLSKHGKWTLASWSSVSGVWLAAFVSMMTSGGFQSAAFAWYLPMLLLAGLVGSRRFCVFWSVVSLASLIFFMLPMGEALVAQHWVSNDSQFHNQLISVMQLAVTLALIMAYLGTHARYDHALLSHVQALEAESERRHQAELVATQSNKVKTKFLKNMSHELRTPLNAIIGFSGRILLRDSSLSERSRDALAAIKRNGEALSLLVDDVIELAAMDEQSEDALVKETFDLKAAVDKHVAQAQTYACEHGVAVTLANVRSVRVKGPDELFGRALQSVVFFCISQMREGQIYVSTESSVVAGQQGTSVLVKDSSAGMTPEQAKVLFEGHYQFIMHNDKALPISAISLIKLKNQLNQCGCALQLRDSSASGNEFELWLPNACEHKLTNRLSEADEH